MYVWKMEFLLNAIGIIYIIIKEQKECEKSKGQLLVTSIFSVSIYVALRKILGNLNLYSFCALIGVDIVNFLAFHKWLFHNSLMECLCRSLTVYQIYKSLLILCHAFSYGTMIMLGTPEETIYFYLYVYQFIGILLLSRMLRKIELEKIMRQRIIQCVILILSIIIFLALVWVLKLARTSLEYLNSIGYLLVIICVILGAIWLYDKQNELKIKKRLEEDNMLLASRVHKTKEIIPAVAEELKEISKELGENREERICNLAEEMKSLQKTYVQDYSTSYTQSYHTGYRLLDRQLEGYERETAEKGIGCLIMLKDKPSCLSKEIGMSQGEIQQVVGDLMRNAIRAVESSEEKEGRILFCFGYVPGNGTYVLEVYDNGTAFPREILDHLGTRGMTTAGTGHGLADVRETVEKYGGRLEVEELAEDIYEKVVRVIIKAGKEAR